MSSADALAASLGRAVEEATGEEAFRQVIAATVDAVGGALGLSSDEVAIFLPTASEPGFFRFAAPDALYKDGSRFPGRGSQTLRVFESGAPLLDNNVKVKKPLSIYERAKISSRRPRPIQKMAAVRLESDGLPVGVLQASRRGAALREAGPDFSRRDLETLGAIALAAGPYVRRTLPDEF